MDDREHLSVPLPEVVLRALPSQSRLRQAIERLVGRDMEQLEPALRELLARILIAPTASEPTSVRPLLQPVVFLACETAFLESRVLRLLYVDGRGQRTGRRVEPHGLLFRRPHWFLVAMDRDRRAARTFRVDRVLSAEPEAVTFKPTNPCTLLERNQLLEHPLAHEA